MLLVNSRVVGVFSYYPDLLHLINAGKSLSGPKGGPGPRQH